MIILEKSLIQFETMQPPVPAAETDERIPDPLSQNHSQSTRTIARAAFSDAVPVRINADNQKKWTLVCYPAIIILVIVFLSLIAALALPQALVPVNEQQWVEGTSVQSCQTHVYLRNNTITCDESGSKNYSAMGAFVTNLSPLNQFLVLYLDIKPGNYGRDFYLNEVVNFSLYSAQRTIKNGSALAVMTVTSQISTTNISLVGKVKDLFTDNQFFILYMSKLSAQDEFYWELDFAPDSQLRPETYYLNSQIVNQNFSYFAIFLRVGLFVVAFAVFVKYNRLIFLLPSDRVSIEQRTIQVLSVVTLTFNDQLYFISIIAPNPFSSFISSFFLSNFVTFLFIIWALFLDRIRKPEPDNNTSLITMPMAVIVFICYALILGYSVAYAITQTTDHPVFSYEDVRSAGVIAMEVVAFMAFSLACVYIIYLFVYTLMYKPNRPYRHNVFMALSAAFFISTVVFFFVGGYDLYNYSASKIFFTFCFMNMYSFFLQYLYAPSLAQIRSIYRETAPLVAPDIDIPDCGEVLVDISDASEYGRASEDGRASEAGKAVSVRSDQSEESKEGSISARERRKRNRKLRGLNKSRENNEKGETNSQINNNNSIEDHPEDEFS